MINSIIFIMVYNIYLYFIYYYRDIEIEYDPNDEDNPVIIDENNLNFYKLDWLIYS